MYSNMFMLLTAGQNLFSEQWTEGNLYEIQPIVNVLSQVSVWVISIVGFGIVIFSILKNALSGLYVINPTLWDKVDDIKNQAVAGVSNTIQQGVSAYNGRGSAVAQKLGGVATFLLSLIPNVKALTDFEDGAPVDKKQYFMRSIPLLVFQIFIGMFIFFGYPSKIANWIGSAGTYMVDAMINNVDPVEVIQGVSDKITVYTLATDGSPLPFDKVVNSATSKMLSTVQTRYRDMQKEPTQETAYALERYLQTALSKGSAESVLGAEEGYDINIICTPTSGVPALADAFKYVSTDASYPLVRAQAVNGTIQYKTWINANNLPTGSTKVGSEDYFVWTITATPVSVSKTSSATMIICAGYNANATASTGKMYNVRLQGLTIGNGESDLRGTPGPVSVDIVDSQGTVIASTSATLQTTNINQTSGATPVLVFDEAQWNSIQGVIRGSSYLRVALSGTWSVEVRESSGSNAITTTVNELRLVSGVSKATYALNIWDDFGDEKYTGKQSAYEALKAGSLNDKGTAE